MKLLSESTIQKLAGQQAFDKGQEYYDQGRVGPIKIANGTIQAKVNGGEQYQITLRHTASVFEGSCSCPASDNFDFCKHCVAASLAYYYQTQTNQEAEADNALEHYLETLTKPELIKSLNSILQANSQLQDLWKLRAELAHGGLNSKDLRKRITQAIPYRSSKLWRFNDVADYFSNSEAMLLALGPSILNLPAEDSIKLVLYAYERIAKCLRNIDDPSGYHFAVTKLLDDWFLQISDSFTSSERIDQLADLINSDHAGYRHILAETGLLSTVEAEDQKALFDALLNIWNAMSEPLDSQVNGDSSYTRLEEVLLEYCSRSGNTELELEIRGKGAVTFNRVIDLLERCLQLGEVEQAAKWHRYATQLPNLSASDMLTLEASQINLWLQHENYQAALKAQWSLFIEDESLARLQEALSTAKHLDLQQQYLDDAIVYLLELIQQSAEGNRKQERAETLMQIYLQSEQVNSAIKFAGKQKLRVGTLMAICRAATHLNADVVRLANRAVNLLVDYGSQETFDRAVYFIRWLVEHHGSNQNDLMDRIIANAFNRPEHKRKPQFMSTLRAVVGEDTAGAA